MRYDRNKTTRELPKSYWQKYKINVLYKLLIESALSVVLIASVQSKFFVPMKKYVF